MRYVQRDGQAKICGDFANPQPGYAEEPMADDDPELLAFLAPKPPDPRVVEDEAQREACKADGTILALIDQTRAEWASWAQTNFPTLTADERNRMGVICWLLAVAIRRLMR